MTDSSSEPDAVPNMPSVDVDGLPSWRADVTEGDTTHEVHVVMTEGQSPRVISRRTATLWNLFFSYGEITLMLVRNLGLVPLYLHFISLKEYGAWLSTGALLGYLTIVDFGIMGVLTQQMAAAYGGRRHDRMQRLGGTGLAVGAALSVVVALLGAVVAPWIPGMMHMTGDGGLRLFHCFLIVAACNGLNLLSFAGADMLKSLQRPIIPGVVGIFSEVCSLAVTTGMLFYGYGLYSIAGGLAIKSIIQVLANIAAFLRVSRRELGLRLGWSWADAISLWRLSLYQFGSSVAARMWLNADTFFVGLLLGTEAAAAYVLTVRAHDMARLLVGRIGDAMLPSLAHLAGEGNMARVRSLVVTAVKIQLVIGAISMCGVIAFNKAFVGLWVGSDKFAGMPVTWLFGLWGIGSMIIGVMYNALFAVGEIAGLCRVSWFDLAVRIPALVMLLYFVGAWGAPAASLVAQLTLTLWLLIRLFKRRLQFDKATLLEVAKSFPRLVAAPLILTVIVTIWVRPPTSWFSFVGACGVFVALCGLVTFFTAPDLIRFIRNREIMPESARPT